MKSCRRCLGVPPLDGSPSRCNGTGYACHAPNVTEAYANGWPERLMCDDTRCDQDPRNAPHLAHGNFIATKAGDLAKAMTEWGARIEQVARRYGPIT